MLSCPLCLKPHFQGVDSLRSTLIAAATSHLNCPVCDESLLGLDKLTIHLFTHINNPKVQNCTEESCKEIDKSIDKVANEQNNKTDLATRIKCDICNFTFSDKSILDMHLKLLHQTTPDKTTGMYSYHCHLCSKKFKKRGSLMVHLRVAHYGFNNQSVEFIVPENATPGGIVVSSEVPSSPNNTSSGTKDNNKQWECDVCSKMFTTKYFLKKHKRLHTGEMPYLCSLCNKSFTFQQSYHKHMLYHSSEKPYVCNECGRAFKELSTLQNHARIHSGERPFGCETCGKRFRQRVSYLVHQRIHTGVMPYKCTACQKCFRYKVSQRSHKCPMNPPGNVERIIENNNPKTVLSVDYATGNINFMPQDDAMAIRVDANNRIESCLSSPNSGLGSPANNSPENPTCGIFNSDQPDLFSMVLSPLLPEVESLCLATSSAHHSAQIMDDEEIVINKQVGNNNEDPLKGFFGNN